MIEKIIDWCSENRYIVLLAYVTIVGLGIHALVNLPVDAIPDLSENQVIVFTEWMGRSPEIVEEQITFPISSALQGLATVKAVRATTMFGMSFVFVIFEDDTDLYFARSRVIERLNTLKSQLPPGVTPNLGPDGTGVGHIFWYTLDGPQYDLATLRSIQDWYVRLKLSAVSGVAEVAGIGGFVKQYQVDIDPNRLRALQISPQEIVQALQRNNNQVGGKLIELTNAEYFVRGQGYIRSVQDLENIIIKSTKGIPLYLHQAAKVQLGGDLRRGSLEKDGQGEAVGGIVVMRSGENAQEVINRIKAKIEEISPGLPQGVRIVASYDRSALISAAMATLRSALLEAAIIVSLVVAIFLLHGRSIIRIIIEIPVSVLIAFILMRLFNITSNIMSLGGIILGIGVIVDSSIVLVENGYRNIAQALQEKGELSAPEYTAIAILSAKQVGRAIFFSELIILVSFLPVFMLTGQEGKLFKPLAFTKTFIMAGSAIVAITLIPVLMTFLMRGRFRSEEKNPVSRFFTHLYRPIILWVLRHKKTTVILNLLALVITAPMILSMGSEFMPPLDEGSLLFMPVTLANASITEVNRIMQVQDNLICSVPEVAHVLGKAGRAETATDNAPLSMIETIILLKPKSHWRPGLTKKDIINELDQKLQIPGVRNGWTQPIINRINMLATGVRTDIGLKIYGNNLDSLEYFAMQAEQILTRIPGAADVVAERNQDGYYLDIQAKPEALAQYGISIGDLQNMIEIAIGGENIGSVLENRMRFPIRLRFSREWRDNPDALKQLLIPVPAVSRDARASAQIVASAGRDEMTAMNGMERTAAPSSRAVQQPPSTFSLYRQTTPAFTYLPLSALATIIIRSGPPMINSENGMLRSIVYMNVRDRDMGHVMEDSRKAISQELHLPTGYSYSWSGQYESKLRSQRTILLIMPIVLVIIFLMLYLTLHDAKEALVVMLSVPFALIGGVYMIYALDYNFSVAVWVGFIALYGIAVETGVVMVVYLHEALDRRIREADKGRRGPLTEQDIYDATVAGSVLRLRPKLMTVGTSMIGLLPVMWATGAGADVMKPLTAPMIGGLFTSAVHVLIVTPVLFAIMKNRALKKGTLKASRMVEWLREG